MILELAGNYFLKVEFGGSVVPIEPQMIKEISITQDIDAFCPTFRIAVKDNSGLLINFIPYDKDLNSVSIQLGKSIGSVDLNLFDFRVIRRTPTSDGIYEISGVLDVPNLFSTRYSRSWSGKVKSIIEEIAEDFEVSDFEIGESLNYTKTLVQPNCSDAKFLNYLKKNLIGKTGEAGYFCAIKNTVGKKTLVFRSVDEIFVDPIKYNFIFSDLPYEDYYPILDAKIYDNSQLISEFSAKEQDNSYFDFTSGAVVSNTVEIEDVPSISEQFLINDDNYSNSAMTSFGRSNDFTSDFSGKAKNTYYEKMSNLIHMWITTWGLENCSPGDLINIVYAAALKNGGRLVYQHSGTWMVKRVVHLIGMSYQTNLLLTRGGIDTDVENTLTVADNRKRR